MPPEDDAGPEGPAPLTPEQWKTLERCAGYDENDADNGKRLLEWFGAEVLHVLEAGWFAWTGTHWDVENGQHAIERCAHKLIPLIKRESIVAEPDEQSLIAEADRLREEHPNPRTRPEDVKEAIKLGDAIAKGVASRRHGRFQFAIRSGEARPRP